MLNNKKTLKSVFIFEVIFFFLIIFGVLPRNLVPYFVTLLALYLIFSPIEDGIIFFISSIPLFLAIPITATFDNFNAWRIFSLILFLKWLISKLRDKQWKSLINLKNKVAVILLILLLLMVLSVSVAPDKIAAIKRVIYFINLSLVGFIIYDFIKKDGNYLKKLIKAIAAPIIIVTAVGFLQLASTYILDIYQFIGLWGEKIQCNQFGNQWCNIAVNLGNTWFAYYGEQISLRVFSLFPDSHSFPVFILLGLPAIFTLSLYKVAQKGLNLKQMARIRGTWFTVLIPLMFLIMILSGTRGIWLASIGIILLVFSIIIFMKKKKEELRSINLFKYISCFIILFFILFVVAYPIFVSPQFLLSKGDTLLFGGRIRSIIDFYETSNKQRIEIWKKSLISIKNHPLLGVGIGNFPVVLAQDIKLAKAGSSAHNLYLHIAAELGIPALLLILWLLWIIFKKTYKNFTNDYDPFLKVYFASVLIFISWVFIYLLTDAAIFDERAFLLFVAVAGTILATRNNSHAHKSIN